MKLRQFLGILESHSTLIIWDNENEEVLFNGCWEGFESANLKLKTLNREVKSIITSDFACEIELVI